MGKNTDGANLHNTISNLYNKLLQRFNPNLYNVVEVFLLVVEVCERLMY